MSKATRFGATHGATHGAAAILAGLFLMIAAGAQTVRAENATPYPGTQVIKTTHGYTDLIARLDAAVKANKMGLVTRASATMGAKSLGKTIPGNMVIGVYNPKFAIRMLDASVAAGIEAPLRFYITENSDKTATLTYRKPTAVFAPYESDKLNTMAIELDVIFARIAATATGG
ncbi:MAG: DUF302 domain-containing protein [Alphaproteobacteria bacterium]